MLSSDRLAQLVGGVDMLPSAPKAFQEILSCLQQSSPSVADAAKIIGRDTAMTANVIKLVNSAFFGSRQPIRTAERAVAYLGLDTLGALVLGHSTFKTGATTLAGFSLERLWQHSLDTALAARTVALCEKWSNAQAEEAFLAGILHDVGKIVFATRPATAAVEIDPNGDVCEQMALHHAEVGAYLLGLWGFPNPIIEAVAFHHTPSLAPGAGLRLPGLIHVANLLAHRNDGPSGKFAVAADAQGQFSELEALGLAARWPEWVAAMDALGAERTVA
jgi:putative nucleotidyltransferase with HDIG domain